MHWWEGRSWWSKRLPLVFTKTPPCCPTLSIHETKLKPDSHHYEGMKSRDLKLRLFLGQLVGLLMSPWSLLPLPAPCYIRPSPERHSRVQWKRHLKYCWSPLEALLWVVSLGVTWTYQYKFHPCAFRETLDQDTFSLVVQWKTCYTYWIWHTPISQEWTGVGMGKNWCWPRWTDIDFSVCKNYTKWDMIFSPPHYRICARLS